MFGELGLDSTQDLLEGKGQSVTIAFSSQTNRVLQLAQQEAEHFSHEYIGTEHILLGLIRDGSSVAANTLSRLDIDLGSIRREIERIVQHGPGGDRVVMGRLPRTPRAQSAIDLAVVEASDLGHESVGPEHLLLGLIREEEGVAAQVLLNLGVQLEEARAEVVRELRRPQVDPDWFTWNDGTVKVIAGRVVQDQCWDIMPILADALEEAGCTDSEMLAHLREGVSHGCARRSGCGCWAIDRLLGAESPQSMMRRRRPAKRWWQFWR